MGKDADVDVSLSDEPVLLQPGDWLLLCSDGVSNTVPHKKLAQILQGHDHATKAAESIIHRAIVMNATDNVTAVVVGYAIDERPRRLSVLEQVGQFLERTLQQD